MMKVVPPPSPPTTPSRGDPGAHWLHLDLGGFFPKMWRVAAKVDVLHIESKKNSSGKHSPSIKHNKNRMFLMEAQFFFTDPMGKSFGRDHAFVLVYGSIESMGLHSPRHKVSGRSCLGGMNTPSFPQGEGVHTYPEFV